MDEYYCSQKFWWLTVEPERRTMNSCCAARATKIDLSWLRENPGQLFNTPKLLEERQDMLDNKPVASCEDVCWSAERRGLPSRRTVWASTHRTHTEIQAQPKVLHIVVGSDCNLTCSYCCKQYSTAWLRDINNNGEYLDSERFQLNTNDRIVLQMGQSGIKNSEAYRTVLKEVQNFRSAEQIEITGGEPLLYNGLPELVKSFDCPTDIFTGLGVNFDRLIKILNALPDHTTFTVSAENLGTLYEFNRYGNTWDQFQRNFDAIANRFQYRFSSVLSNLTIHGFDEFEQQFGSDKNLLNFCTDPDYLSASVLDTQSKLQLNQYKYKYHDQEIKKTLSVQSTKEQKTNLKKYLTEFARRRSLSLEIFPEHFINWINTEEKL